MVSLLGRKGKGSFCRLIWWIMWLLEWSHHPVTISLTLQYICVTVVIYSNQLHYVILLFTLASDRYLESHKLQSHMSWTVFVFLIAKVGGKWNIITRLRTVCFSSGKRHTDDLRHIMILSSLEGYRKQIKTQIKQKRKTQKGHNYRSDNISF
jgi:hypothetical protein